ncbi:hypothetical protein C4D60_Mb06t01520 [Musa balbisiana]|uniref:Uncharacterized protein n=1 Tax=Musa balbisiana TaxID=52838 RepID=A0A4V4H3L0_MUSBA|nr:hypothetical protein C4D60_Mb06t01520 [Musa balbisiana]
MLIKVTEMVSGPEKEIVGLVRGCIKTVDLRGSPCCRGWSDLRRSGRGTRTWRRRDGEGQRVVFPPLHWAVRLLQVPHPRYPGAPGVSPHRLPLPPRVAILRLTPADPQALYRRRFAATEFFPRDIDTVLANPLSLGTFLAVPPSPVNTHT